MSSDEAVEADLKKHFNAGLSGTEIADVLNRDHGLALSRSAVCGMVHRARQKDASAFPARARSGGRGGRRPVAAGRRPRVSRRAVPALVLVPIEPAPEPVAELEIPVEQRRSLFELNDQTCRWPVGDPQEPSFFFCGGQPAPCSPYCRHHTFAAGAGYSKPAARPYTMRQTRHQVYGS